MYVHTDLISKLNDAYAATDEEEEEKIIIKTEKIWCVCV